MLGAQALSEAACCAANETRSNGMTKGTDVHLLASSMIGDGLNPSPYKEALARAERAEAELRAIRGERGQKSGNDDLIAQIEAFLADAPKGKPHTGYRYGELLAFAAAALREAQEFAQRSHDRWIEVNAELQAECRNMRAERDALLKLLAEARGYVDAEVNIARPLARIGLRDRIAAALAKGEGK